MPSKQKVKNKRQKSQKSLWKRNSGKIGMTYIIDFAIVLAVFGFIIGCFCLLFWYGNYSDNITFKRYESFAKKTLPNNFKLVKTEETPSGIDNQANVTQDYQVSGTRAKIIQELIPNFAKYGYTYKSDNTTHDSSGNLIDTQDFGNKNAKNNYPLGIFIQFIPTDCAPSDDSLTSSDAGCDILNSLPTHVTKVEINWTDWYY